MPIYTFAYMYIDTHTYILVCVYVGVYILYVYTLNAKEIGSGIIFIWWENCYSEGLNNLLNHKSSN